MDKVVIRPMAKKDIPAAAKLMESMWIEHGSKTRLIDPVKIIAKPATDYIGRHTKQGDVFFVAESDGKIVGTVSGMLEELPRYYRYDKRLTIDNLSVAPKWRGQGIAGRLVQACEDFAREHNIPTIAGEIWSFNDASKAVFTKQDYSPDANYWYKIIQS